VPTNHGELLAQEYNTLFFETSSKIGTNVNNALITLSRYDVFSKPIVYSRFKIIIMISIIIIKYYILQYQYA